MRIRRKYLVAAGWIFPFLIRADPLRIPSSSGGIIEKELQQQYEQKPPSPDKSIPSIEVEIPEKELDLSEKKKFTFQKIVVRGNTILPPEEIEAVVSAYERRSIAVEEIRLLCAKVQNLYAEKGYFLVRVYPPAQEIRRRTLYLEVMEAKLSEVEVTGNTSYTKKFISSYFKKYIGKTINYHDLLKTLLLVNENSDLKVGTIFQKGKEAGTVDMILEAEDRKPLHIGVDFNNYGSNVTTRLRSGLRTDVGNIFQDGDMLSLIGVIGYPVSDLRFIDTIYTTPLNRAGSDLEFSFLFSDFRVDRLTELHLRGKTQIVGTKYIQALQRTKKLNTDLYVGFEYKQIRNFANHTTSAFDKLRELSVGCKVDYVDALRGHNVADFAVFAGIPDFLGGLKPVDPSCSRAGAGGRFVYIDGSYRRIQRLPGSCLLFVNFQGQLSFYKLPVSDEFYIGGINTVRGYPLACAVGDTGFSANVELRVPPPILKSRTVPFSKKPWKEVLQLVGFVDHGEVFVYGGGITGQPNSLYLTSIGIGARLFGPYGIECSADVGFPLVDRGVKTQDAIVYFRINMRFL